MNESANTQSKISLVLLKNKENKIDYKKKYKNIKQNEKNNQNKELKQFKKAFLSYSQCQICCRKYNKTLRLPLVVCDQLHKLCLDCYNQMSRLYKLSDIQNFPKCPFCRVQINRLRLAKDLLNLLEESNLIQQQKLQSSQQHTQLKDYLTFIQTYMYQQHHRKVYEKNNQGKTINESFEQFIYSPHAYSISLIRIQNSPIRFGYYEKTYQFSSEDKFQAVDHYFGICNAGIFVIGEDDQIETIETFEEISKNSQTYKVTQRMLIQGLVRLKMIVTTNQNSIVWKAYEKENKLIQEKRQKIQISYGFLNEDLDYLHNFYLKQNTSYFKKFDLDYLKNK